MTGARRVTTPTQLNSGVHAVMVTPFLPDESIDNASLETLINGLAEAGCVGLLVLGVMGEADRLSDAERESVIAETIAAAAGRLQVTVGITHPSTRICVERAHTAASDGANAVMVSPPVGSAAGPVLKEHFRRIGNNLPIPIVIQDHPPSSGVKLPVEFLAELVDVVPPGSTVKLEDPPAAPKIARLRALTSDVQILGGLGGVSLIDELDAGAEGVMTGFGLPEVLVAIVAAHQRGDSAAASELYTQALPLMLFEAQPGAGAALRKELLVRRGLIAHSTVRQPANRPDPWALRRLDELVAKWSNLPTERTRS